jgi:DNA polymerase III delta prime subunit
MLLTGPAGCGKTAAVYACAAELGHTVLEIHAGMRRAGRCVTDMLSEATQSRRVLAGAWAASTSTAAGTGPGTDDGGCIVVDDDPSDPSAAGAGAGTGADAGASIILVEDVDVLFADDDRGFWAALAAVAETARRPIIFTANTPDPYIPAALRYQRLAFRAPPVLEAAALACVVCLV